MALGLLLNRDKCWLLNLPRDNLELGERALGIRWLHGEDTEQLLGYTVGHHRLRNHRMATVLDEVLLTSWLYRQLSS